MKTEYKYSVESNVAMEEMSLNLSDCKIAFLTKQNNFLSEIKLIANGTILETGDIAYKIIKFIRDFFIINYGNGSFKSFRIETKEISDDKSVKKRGNKNLPCKTTISIGTDIRTRKAIKNKEELSNNMNDALFVKKRKLLSALADGLMASSIIDKYRNLFEVIEGTFHPQSGQTAEDLKKTSLKRLISELKDLKWSLTSEEIIDDLVGLRNACSHLKPKEEYGLSTSELKDVKKIKKYLPLIEKIARRLITDKR